MQQVLYNSKFFRADNRKIESSDDFQSASVCVENTIVLKDIFLAPGATYELTCADYDFHVVIPVAGSVQLSADAATEIQLAPEKIYGTANHPEIALAARNDHKETVNFIYAGYNIPFIGNTSDEFFDLAITCKDRLFSGSGLAKDISIGVYDSRVKDVFRTGSGNASVFAFVLNGSFEVEGRLMEYRDSLLLRDTGDIEFEALSEMAIILFIAYSHLNQ